MEDNEVVGTSKPSLEEVIFWEGHKVVTKGAEKTVGVNKFFSSLCDDGCTYDVPAEYFK